MDLRFLGRISMGDGDLQQLGFLFATPDDQGVLPVWTVNTYPEPIGLEGHDEDSTTSADTSDVLARAVLYFDPSFRRSSLRLALDDVGHSFSADLRGFRSALPDRAAEHILGFSHGLRLLADVVREDDFNEFTSATVRWRDPDPSLILHPNPEWIHALQSMWDYRARILVAQRLLGDTHDGPRACADYHLDWDRLHAWMAPFDLASPEIRYALRAPMVNWEMEVITPKGHVDEEFPTFRRP